MKKLYFIHSTNFDYRNEYYLPIQQCSLSEKYELIFPHSNSEKPFSSKDLFQSGECDIVIAEVSYPTTGGGIEIGWADALGLPIIMLAREESKYSNYLKNLCASFIQYKNKNDLTLKLQSEISKIDKCV